MPKCKGKQFTVKNAVKWGDIDNYCYFIHTNTLPSYSSIFRRTSSISTEKAHKKMFCLVLVAWRMHIYKNLFSHRLVQVKQHNNLQNKLFLHKKSLLLPQNKSIGNHGQRIGGVQAEILHACIIFRTQQNIFNQEKFEDSQILTSAANIS